MVCSVRRSGLVWMAPECSSWVSAPVHQTYLACASSSCCTVFFFFLFRAILIYKYAELTVLESKSSPRECGRQRKHMVGGTGQPGC